MATSKIRRIPIRMLVTIDSELSLPNILSRMRHQLLMTSYIQDIQGMEEIQPDQLKRMMVADLPSVELPTIKEVHSGRRKTDPIHYVKEPMYEQKQQTEKQSSSS